MTGSVLKKKFAHTSLARSFLLGTSVLAIGLGCGQAAAQVFQGPGVNWSVGSNWSGGNVPTAASLAQVISGIPDPFLANLGAAKNLHIDNNKDVIVGAGGNLQVGQTISIGRTAGVNTGLIILGGGQVTAQNVLFGDGASGSAFVSGGSLQASNSIVVSGYGGGSQLYVDSAAGSSVRSLGTIENRGVTGTGVIINYGSLTAVGDISNRINAHLWNYNTTVTQAHLVNAGMLGNWGSLQAGTGIVNSGPGIMGNMVAGAVIETATGDFVNQAGGQLANVAGASVSAHAGNVINDAASYIANDGSISAGQRVINYGAFDNSATGTVIGGTGVLNTGSFRNLGGLVSATTGNVDNFGTLTNGAGGRVQAVAGNVTNYAGGSLVNAGTVSANQQFVNAGTVNTNTGSITGGTGVINTATGIFQNDAGGTLTATAGGVLNNGILTNNGGATVQALAGNVTNAGKLTNNAGGTVRALNGSVNNQVGGNLSNAGSISASQQFVNAGTVGSNTGGITGGTGVINTATGVFQNNAGGTLTATAGGVLNIGSLTNTSGATVQALAGDVTNAGQLTNNAGGTVRAIAGNVVNQAGGNLSNAGSVSASQQFVNAGTVGSNTGGITGATGVVNTATGVFQNNAGGTLTATAGGVVNNGQLTNAGGATVQALAGDVTNAGQLTNSASGVVRAVSGNVINQAGAGMSNAGTVTAGLQFMNAGTVVSNTGGITGATGVINTATGVFQNNAGGNLSATTGNVTNAGQITNAAGAAIRALSGNILNTAGVLTNAGTLDASGTINNAALLNSTGVLKAGTSVLNSGTANVSGQIITPTVSNSGTFNVLGNVNSTISTFNNSGTTNVTGGDLSGGGTFNNTGTTYLSGGNLVGFSAFNNSNTLNVMGNRSIGPATAFTNAGTISLRNGSVSDNLNINGSYVGNAGSTVVVDIDLSQTSGTRADQVQVSGGTGSGTTGLQFNIVSTGRTALTTPIPVFVLMGGGSVSGLTGSLTSVGGGAANQGFFQYNVQESAPGSGRYQVVSTFNAAPAQGVAAGLSGMVTALQAGFHQPNSAIISRPDNCSPNQLMGGPFIRVNGGDTKISSNSSGSGSGLSFTGTSSTKADFKGIQGGVDIGICNVQGTGWNIHTGLMGGFVDVDSKGVSRTRDSLNVVTSTTTNTKVEVPFFGLYAFVTKDNFVFEANIRKDFYNTKITSRDPGQVYVGPDTKLHGHGLNFNVASSYRFSIGEAFYFEPNIGLSIGSTSFGRLQFSTANTDFMTFRRSESLLGRVGFNAGYTWMATERLVLVPFVHASVWHEFSGDNKATASIGTTPLTFDVRTDRVGTFGQVGLGLQFKLLNSPFLGFVRGDVRFGKNLDGKAFNAGVRMQF